MLGAIRAVTYTVPDLAAVEDAYVRVLGYRVTDRTLISQPLADSWLAPAMAGCRALVLAPASGEPVYLRFIEDARAAGWRSLVSFGWNVSEYVVQDVDALAERLAGSVFEIIGPPRPLTRFPMIRAMQATGPAGECCYFTEVGPGSGLVLAAARAFVGRVFIVVAAGPDADALQAPYAALGNQVEAPVATPVRVISRAHGLSPDALHRHGLVRLAEGTLVELDEYPRSATARATHEGRLPAGMALVAFDVPGLQGIASIAPPAAEQLPGVGLAACVRGAAGELIQLVTSAPAGI